jgi:Zn-dependent M16 (insulinase) family peptidase
MIHLRTGDRLSGFKVGSVLKLPENHSYLITLVHLVTGCEVIHLYNKDRERLFSFIFRTPPEDNAGVPHIIEHAVLCGSRCFPLKDPFVLLLKGSMKTFLNAFTAPDCTMYVGSSTIEQDFFNLMLVYGDAVFSPLLKEEVFMQEGHHCEFNNDGRENLKIVGVVYNEMKGSYSDPESIVYDYSCRSLFSDNVYRYEAGGDPEHIPDLTFDQFLRYYKKYYHPSNCKIFLYGDISTEKVSGFVHKQFLSGYAARSIKSSISYQKRWKTPRIVEKTFPIADHLDTSARSIITMNWLLCPVTDSFLLLSFKILAEILVGNAGSPLRKALVESGLAEDISPATGLETGFKEIVFSVGVRGTDPEKREDIVALVMHTLMELEKKGWDTELLEAAIHRIVFRNREISSSGGPYGLRQMMRVLKRWLYNANTADVFYFDKWMERFRKKIEKDRGYLQRVIRQYLINNNHRTLLLVKPDHDHQRREDEKLIKRLSFIESSQTELEKVEKSLKRLREYQNTPDSLDDIDKIPALTLKDMPGSPPSIPVEEMFILDTIPLYFHDIYTNGIIYIDFAFDMNGIDEELIPVVTLFRKAVCGAGLPGMGYDMVARKLSLLTGGFFSTFSTNIEVRRGESRSSIVFRTKVLEENAGEALSLITELILHADFQDRRRLKDMIIELRNNYRSSLIPSGNFYASLRAGSKLSPSLFMEEKVRGIEQILYLIGLSKELDKKIAKIEEQLQRLRTILITQSRLRVNITCEKSKLTVIEKYLGRVLSSLPEGLLKCEDKHTKRFSVREDALETIAMTTNVGYMAHAFSAAPYIAKENALQAVLSHLINTGYLWEEVRVKGGAYGASAQLFGTEGIFIFSSYRDPNIRKTFNAFRDSLITIRDKKITADQVEKAIIGTISKSEKPYTPAKLGYISFKRILYGISDEMRQKRRDIMLATNLASLTHVSDELLHAYDRGTSVIIAGKQTIFSESEMMKELKKSLWEIEI